MIDIEKELSLGGEPFPQNQTLWNFFDYLLVPSLVYEQSYPRTSRYLLMLLLKLIWLIKVSLVVLFWKSFLYHMRYGSLVLYSGASNQSNFSKNAYSDLYGLCFWFTFAIHDLLDSYLFSHLWGKHPLYVFSFLVYLQCIRRNHLFCRSRILRRLVEFNQFRGICTIMEQAGSSFSFTPLLQGINPKFGSFKNRRYFFDVFYIFTYAWTSLCCAC